jgi:hypothetical protein
LGIIWRALEWKLLEYFWAIRNILCPFGTICGHLEILLSSGTFWYIVPRKNLATLRCDSRRQFSPFVHFLWEKIKSIRVQLDMCWPLPGVKCYIGSLRCYEFTYVEFRNVEKYWICRMHWTSPQGLSPPRRGQVPAADVR